jgi:hypothetical protein
MVRRGSRFESVRGLEAPANELLAACPDAASKAVMEGVSARQYFQALLFSSARRLVVCSEF